MIPTYGERQELARQFATDVACMRVCLQAAGRQAEDDDIVYAWADYSDAVRASWLMLPDTDEALLATLLIHLRLAGKRWRPTMLDAGDGTGDGILPLPEELLAQAGWQEGDALTITENEAGDLILRRLE
jgi:hypothetical protein